MTPPRKKCAPDAEPRDPAAAPDPAATAPESAAAEVAAPSASVDTAEYWRDHCLRAMAEVQNLKRRAGQEVEERTLLRLEGLLADLLRVDDYFAAALGQIPETVRGADGGAAFLDGVSAIRQALEGVLLAHGATFLAPGHDAAFDPAEHEAVEVVEEPGLSEPRLELLSRGCRFGRRILRPARVRLIRPPAAG